MLRNRDSKYNPPGVWTHRRVHVAFFVSSGTKGSMLDLPDLVSRCADDPLEALSERRCAAVALMFADGADGLEMCFVKRKEYPGDPWSGDRKSVV